MYNNKKSQSTRIIRGLDNKLSSAAVHAEPDPTAEAPTIRLRRSYRSRLLFISCPSRYISILVADIVFASLARYGLQWL